MALFTSANGWLEITELSFTPKVVAWGEQVSCTFTVNNISSNEFKTPNLYLYIRFLSTRGTPYSISVGVTEPKITWKKGKKITRTFTATLYREDVSPDFEDSRVLLTYDGYGAVLALAAENSLRDEFHNIYGDNHEYLAIIDKHYNPAITTFETERVSDEAESIKTTAKLSLTDGLTDTQKAYMAWTVKDTNGNALTLGSDVTLDQLLTGITDSTTFIPTTETQKFPKEDNIKLTLAFGDAYESVSTESSIARSFANVHLSGNSAGGVCFGGFCDSDNPGRFECYFDTRLYKGLMNIKYGKTEQASHANGTEETVTFTAPFTAVPMVIVCADVSTDGSSFGGCFTAVKDVTESGFTIRYANTSGSERKFAVRWFAYCPTC